MRCPEAGLIGAALLVLLALTAPAKAQRLPDGRGGSFDVSRHGIDREEILAGGPPRDGIPALTDPQFVPAREGDRYLRDQDRVLGVEHLGLAKAYPIKILNWHEVVNDRIGGRPIAVTW